MALAVDLVPVGLVSAGLCARDLVVGYGQVNALNGASLTITPGRRLALLGANGSGKTTLLRTLAGSLEPASGDVLLDGEPVRFSRAALNEHRRHVQLVLQDPDDQLFSADVYRDVSFGPVNLGLPEDQVRARVEQTLAVLDLTQLAERPTHQLSFGQRKRVAIAGAVAMAPRYLLLDEPTAGLDPVGQDELLAALDRLEAGGTTVVLATHDVDFALGWAADAAVVTGGQVRSGPAGRMLGDLPEGSRLRTPWVIQLSRRLGLEESGPRDLDDVAALIGPLIRHGRH